jgi:hypothetical protein
MHRTTDASGNEADAVAPGPQPPTRRTRDAMASESPVTVAPARYVLLHLAYMLTGYSVKAMQRKIASGVWQQDKLWKRALGTRCRAVHNRLGVGELPFIRQTGGGCTRRSPCRPSASKIMAAEYNVGRSTSLKACQSAFPVRLPFVSIACSPSIAFSSARSWESSDKP